MGEQENSQHGAVTEPILLANLNSPQTAGALETMQMVLIPVGAQEQHGPSLPVSTDALTAQVLCALTGSLLHPKVGVMPVIPWVSPGTIRVGRERSPCAKTR